MPTASRTRSRDPRPTDLCERGIRRLLTRADNASLARVRADGWPELSALAGPPGFLRVHAPRELSVPRRLDRTGLLARADRRGDGRVALQIMDHGNRRRLELMGRVAGPGSAERAVVTIESAAWIGMPDATPRFSVDELAELDELLPA